MVGNGKGSSNCFSTDMNGHSTDGHGNHIDAEHFIPNEPILFGPPLTTPLDASRAAVPKKIVRPGSWSAEPSPGEAVSVLVRAFVRLCPC